MKRVLIIAYYWPPAGGPGVQRWLKFVKYFHEFGIDPIVYVPDNPHYPLIDDSLSSEVPDGITILKHPISEPYKWAKIFSKKKTSTMSRGIIRSERNAGMIERLMLYIRGNFFIPDARIGWVKPSVNYLQKYISEENIDSVVTTGPPHSMHLIGMQLKNRLNIRWIADFRDPWTTIHYHKSLRLSKSSARKHKQLESQVLNTADHIVVTSPTTKTEFESLTNRPVVVITNGHDITEFTPAELDKKFSLSHIGSLLSERNPTVLWNVLSELKNEHEAFGDDLEIKLVGAVGDNVLASIREHDLQANCIQTGYVPHREALNLQRSSQILLLLEIDVPQTACILPGKLFEYMAAKRPIMAIGPEGSDIAEILEKEGSGRFFTSKMKDALKNEVWQWYQQFKTATLESNTKDVSKFSRRALTKSMAALLKGRDSE